MGADMSGIDFDMGSLEDNRSYVERMFFNLVDGELVGKNIGRIDCADGPPENLPEDKICLLLNYKTNIKRGRKDSLKGKNVLAIPSDKGHVLIPYEEAVQYANWVFSAAVTAQRLVETKSE